MSQILYSKYNMTLKQYAIDEFKRSPITVTAAAIGVLVAFAALVVAWLAYAGTPSVAATSASVPPVTNFQLTNLLLVMSFFLASSLSCATLIHTLNRAHPFHALVFSIPVAVAVAFLTLLILQLAPPRPTTNQTLNVAIDTVFWATLLVFLAVNGRSTALAVVDAQSSSKRESGSEQAWDDKKEAGGAIFVLFIVLVVWCGVVSAGINKLAQLFLQ
jgi:hypothetical protein